VALIDDEQPVEDLSAQGADQPFADRVHAWRLDGGAHDPGPSEPLIDSLFAETHARAWDMGMMIMISSNGSRLDQPRTLDLLTKRRPYQGS
jgi:hypothetical protein